MDGEGSLWFCVWVRLGHNINMLFLWVIIIIIMLLFLWVGLGHNMAYGWKWVMAIFVGEAESCSHLGCVASSRHFC